MIPRHGMRVLPVSAADMAEIYTVLAALESAAAESLAHRRPSDAELKPLVESTRDMARALKADPHEYETSTTRPTRMTTRKTFSICVLPGDGIGVEVIDATLPILEKAQRSTDFQRAVATYDAGAKHYRATGEALPAATLKAARDADAILFGAMGWPEIR